MVDKLRGGLECLAQCGVFLELRSKIDRTLFDGGYLLVDSRLAETIVWPNEPGTMLIARIYPKKYMGNIVDMHNDPDGKPGMYIRCEPHPEVEEPFEGGYTYIIHRFGPGMFGKSWLRTKMPIEEYNAYTNEWFRNHME